MTSVNRFLLFVPFILCLAISSSVPSSASDLSDALKARDVVHVRALLAAGADVQEKFRGDYPLNIAAVFGPAEMVSVLLDAGADIEKPARDGRRPLHNAVAVGHKDIVALLIEKGAVADSKDHQGRTSLNYFAATGGSDVEIARMLLAAGVDPNIEDVDQWAALNYVARYTGNVELGKLLIAAHADINHRKDNGETPVGTATFHNHYEFAKMLIAAGADVNLANKDGVSPLSGVNDPAMRQLLIDAGAK